MGHTDLTINTPYVKGISCGFKFLSMYTNIPMHQHAWFISFQIAIEYESWCENLRNMGTGLNTNQINALISVNLY